MKTPIFIILALLVISSSLYSQTEKGAVAIGGFIGYQKTTDENFITTGMSKSTSEQITVSPYTGYFVNENLLIGIGFDYSYYQYDYSFGSFQSNESTDKIFLIQPFLKYYWQISDKFSFHSRLIVMFGFGNSEDLSSYDPGIPGIPREENKTEYDVSAMGASLIPGISYAINGWIAVEALVGSISYSKKTYELTNTDGSEDQERKDENFNIIFTLSSISLGVQITL